MARRPQFGAASARSRAQAMRRVGGRGGISTNAEDFAAGLSRLEDRFVAEVAKEAQVRVARIMHKNLVEGTPVLTGRARNNWNVSVGAVNTETTKEVAGVQFTGDPYTDEERRRMAEARQLVFEAPDFPTIYIANSLFYVPGLDLGTSRKAPDGIVLVAFVKTIEEVKNAGG